MLFSSPAFLFGFLPIFLLVYFSMPIKARNGVILIASLLFYFIDGGFFTILLCGSIAFNFWVAILIYRSSGYVKKLLVAIGITGNLIPLFFYKYWMFFLQSINDISNLVNSNIHYEIPKIVLLSGVSFFTFHAISYLLDVNAKKVKPTFSLIDFGMYMSNFPQLIAGPIVRYSEIVDVVRNRFTNINQIYVGVHTFIVGLGKKVILADSAGVIADNIFNLPGNELSTGLAWLGAVTYSLQIYYDFAGYSDMAIGLGRIMGFEFPENFNQPYRAKNITEFWRRWHMTLSRWFRDYVYIPLGGNQQGKSRTLFNLLIVFILCGLWHGASYTFLIWGLYHGFLLVVERMVSARYNYRMTGWYGQLVAFVLVAIGWVIFRSNNLDQAINFILAMFGRGAQSTALISLTSLMGLDKVVYIVAGVLFSIFPMEKMGIVMNSEKILVWIQGVVAVTVSIFCIVLIAANGFNPFIYFKF